MTTQQAVKLAVEHHSALRFDEAELICRQILTKEPNQPDALHLLGVIALQSKRLDEAMELIQRALAIRPDAAEYHNSLGNVLVQKDLLDDAIVAFRRATTLRNNYTKAFSNLGNALKKTGQYTEAISAYRQAMTLSPEYFEAHWNLGLLLLLQGDFRRGWKEFEYRLEIMELRKGKRQCSRPRWDGNDLSGKRILLHPEQGFGDAIQFARYAPMVAECGGRIVLEIQPELHRLFQCLSGVEILAPQGKELPDFEVHCPLMSLPLMFDTTFETIPNDIPYLSPPVELVEHWRRYIATERRKKVGLTWAGNPTHRNDRNRSISFSRMNELMRVPDVQFFSLQKGPAEKQADFATPNATFIDITGEFADFADTAALIQHLDLVITVDTAIAHLAGAMGKPVWVLLPFAPDWRWMLDRSDSPWYPTMQLFRQKTPGDWNEVIERVTRELKKFVSG
jgi:Flp pilus assembly protein TadD